MPKASIVPVDMAVSALKKYIEHFITNDIPRHSSRIWQDISDELNGLWTVSAVRVNIREDRRGILTRARQESGIFLPTPKRVHYPTEKSYYDDGSDTSCEFNINDIVTIKDDDEDDDGFSSFDVKITREQWNRIKCQKPLVYKGRRYCGFVPGVWTNVVTLAFWEQHRLKCAFAFKRGKIYKNGVYYAVLNGQCSDRNCRNPVLGLIKKHPEKHGPVIITMKCRDTRFSEHADIKRPLNGQRRKEVQEKLLRDGVSGWRKEAEKKLRPEDTGSPFLYNTNILNTAKNEAIRKEYAIESEDSDLIQSLQKIAENAKFVNNILDLGDTPVIVLVIAPKS